MANMILALLGFVVVLALLFGFLCGITGEENKENQIIVNCITVLVLYLLIVQLFNIGITQDSVFVSGIPLLKSVDQYGSVRGLLSDAPGSFALDFVELVALTLIINWISNFFSFSESGFVGKILSRIVIVMAGILAYGFFMDFARDNMVIKWCVYCVECIITGGSILYTPAMIVMAVTGLKKGNIASTYFLSQFPKTGIGKAITTAITSSVVFIVFLMIIESQYGSVANVFHGFTDSFESWGAIIVMIMGLYFIIRSIKSKK